MNPFTRLTPLPPGARGERSFQSAAAAKTHADTHAGGSYAVLQAGSEFAWVAPVGTYTARALACLAAGVKVVELKQ